MKTIWTHGMGAEQKKEFVNDFNGSKPVLNRLVEILKKRIEENRTAQCNMEDFNCPNWQYKQTAYIGKEKTLLEVIDLLS